MAPRKVHLFGPILDPWQHNASGKQMLRTQHTPNTEGCVGCTRFCPSNCRVHTAAGGHKDGMDCSRYHWASTAEPFQYNWSDLLVLLVSIGPSQPGLEQSSSNWHFNSASPQQISVTTSGTAVPRTKKETPVYTHCIWKRIVFILSPVVPSSCCKNKAGSNTWRRDVPIV